VGNNFLTGEAYMTPTQIVLKLFFDELEIPLELDAFEKRLMIQKKTYLSQLTGFDLRYRFSWYIHGPYSRFLTADAFALKEALDDGDLDYQGKSLSPLARKLVTTARTIWENRPEDIDDDDWLEALASVHYLKHISYWPASTPREFAEVFQTLVNSKPRFASRERLARLAWDRLEGVGLIARKVLPLPSAS
jgi:hypothetical protein